MSSVYSDDDMPICVSLFTSTTATTRARIAQSV
jgi:hypothetical protein